MVTAETSIAPCVNADAKFYFVRKVNFLRKKIWFFPSLVLTSNVTTVMLQHLIIQFQLYYLSSGRLWQVENKRNFKLLALKVIFVAYSSRAGGVEANSANRFKYFEQVFKGFKSYI